jgi:hypothetical protein
MRRNPYGRLLTCVSILQTRSWNRFPTFAICCTCVIVLSNGLQASAANGATTHVNVVVSSAPSTMASLTNAGYSARPTGSSHLSVSTTVTVPSLPCPVTGNASVVPGITLLGASAHASGGVLVACDDGAFSTSGVACTGGICGRFQVSSRDVVTISGSESGSSIAVSIHDDTSGGGGAVSSTMSGTISQVEIGDSALSGFDVVDFGTIAFSQSELNGKPLGSIKPRAKLNLVDSRKRVEVSTGNFSKGGTAFVIRFVRAS